MGSTTRIWNVSEQELDEESGLLVQDARYQRPAIMPAADYQRLIRKIAYWNICRFRMAALGVINVLLTGGIALAIYLSGTAVALYSLLKILAIITGIFLVLFLVLHYICNIYKHKLKSQ